MPVFWFAVSQTVNVDVTQTILVFVILHLLVYPASNGYNSYMDKDTASIGGIKNPKTPTKQLFYISLGMDTLAILAGFLISIYFVLGITAYILASRAYSYRGIRLKKYPILGYSTVVIFQGAVTYFLVTHGCSKIKSLQVSYWAMAASSLLIGGFYPITQIYQHAQDKADGVTTISMKLGYKGTFIFTAVIYAMAMLILYIYFMSVLQERYFFILQAFLIPVIINFIIWYGKFLKDKSAVNYNNTMRMNLLASVCSNVAFITILILEKFE